MNRKSVVLISLFVALYLVTAGCDVATPTTESVCQVPNLVGLEQAAAEGMIVGLGLQPVKSTQYDSSIADGVVISQDPPAGTRLEPCQGDVVIVINTVPESTRAPSEPTATSPSSTLTEGLVMYYPFNGNTNDESGNGNGGIVEGATLSTDRFGNENSAYALNGLTDYIVSSSKVSLDVRYSVSLWFNYSQSPVGNLFFHGVAEECVYEPRLLVGEDMLHARSSGCKGSGQFGSVSLTPDTWYHAVVIVVGNSQQLYLDGGRVARGSQQTRSSSAKVFVGISSHNGMRKAGESFFKGIVDDVRIYNRALTEAEIQSLYHEGGWEQ
jgi:hypothetical protein